MNAQPHYNDAPYTILIFIIMITLSFGRYSHLLLTGMGKNSLWLPGIVFLFVLLGIRLTLATKKNDNHPYFKLLAPIHDSIIFLYFFGLTFYFTIVNADFYSNVFRMGNPSGMFYLGITFTILFALFPLKAHARYAKVSLIFLLPIFILILFLQFFNTNWLWIFPIINIDEIKTPITSIASVFYVFAPIVSLQLINAYNPNVKKVTLTVFITTIFIILLTYLSIATFGIEYSKKLIYVTYSGLNTIRLERFMFERIIFVPLLIFNFFQILTGAFFLRFCSLYLSKVLRTQFNKFLIISNGLLILLISKINMSPFYVDKLLIILGICTFYLINIKPILILLISKR
ncbi:hypothetical protein [Cytobacillus firmus]|uniref:hypothetical protein n=1 Tax=Cytobacillus firmus TaxID=1399 RepID=UPI0018CCFC75|nr:hypothetical protein [Cytobacillus firmus]MBG9587270.1 hypothetical protein [Cytobacillus firmus]